MQKKRMGRGQRRESDEKGREGVRKSEIGRKIEAKEGEEERK